MVTTVYASILALILVVLSMRVIGLRGNPVFRFFAFRTAGDETLERAIRAHGNFIEYTPMMLILLWLAEQEGTAATSLHAYAGSFLLGRVMHGWCFAFTQRNLVLRVGGTILTLFPLAGLALKLLIN